MTVPDAARTAESVLAERIGLDPQTLGSGAIHRALHTRMAALGLHDRDVYLRRLADSLDEQQELVEEVVIPESWFFRDTRPFVALRSLAADRRHPLETGLAGRLRILSIPCSCGEEPYSIAITLRDLELPAARFQIDAVDVSARHLAVAERGIYRGNAFRGDDLSFRDRYFQFDTQTRSFTLDPALRLLVRFTRGNLLDPGLLAGEPPYDIIFCRNLLIYLDASARRQAFDTIDRLLAPRGIVFVGHADRLATGESRFESHGESGGFTLRRVEPPRPAPKPLPAAAAAATAAAPVPAQRRTAPPPPRSVPRSDPAPIAAEAGDEPAAAPVLPDSSATLLAEAAALADQGRHDEAAGHCERVLERFGPSPRAYFLLGLLRQAAGRGAEAEAFFRKTIYLDPGHDEALLALALITQRRGESAAAAGYRRRAERARARKGTS